MRIIGFKIYRYCLPLKKALQTARSRLDKREGLLLELKDAEGTLAYGEIAPLVGFSAESMEQATKEITDLKACVTSGELPIGLEKLDGAFDAWLKQHPLSPSVRFGLESAVLDLTAQAEERPLPVLMGVTIPAAVRVSALLDGSSDEILSKAQTAAESGFASVKVKVGHLSPEEAVILVGEVRGRIGKEISLRVDANRAFAIDAALDLMHRIKAYDIEYIEEPARNLNQLRKLLTEKPDNIGVALDESLTEIKPDDLALGYPLKAVIIKPSMLGLERACRFARCADENGITSVVSSSYESSVGMRVLAALASAVSKDVPVGLDTLEDFADDLLEPPLRIVGGQIAPDSFHGPLHGLKPELLEEVTDG